MHAPLHPIAGFPGTAASKCDEEEVVQIGSSCRGEAVARCLHIECKHNQYDATKASRDHHVLFVDQEPPES
jgi:hypothetical protein